MRWRRLLAGGAMVALAGAVQGQSDADGRRSGYSYLSSETKALQDNDFANPGMLWVERGEALWAAPDGAANQACADCHGEAAVTMKGVRARYPIYDEKLGKPINLEQRINQCRRDRMRADALAWESEELLALTAFIGLQSRGMPIAVQVDGPMAPFFEAGQAFWFQRRGQLDLACHHCHDQLAGRHLYGDVVSQGQANGFPIYRIMWQNLASLQRMFRWCNSSVRAEPYPFGDEKYVNLELYLAWRGRGLPVETPAVRR